MVGLEALVEAEGDGHTEAQQVHQDTQRLAGERKRSTDTSRNTAVNSL